MTLNKYINTWDAVLYCPDIVCACVLLIACSLMFQQHLLFIGVCFN